MYYNFIFSLDVKMDWCHTKVSGTRWDPKKQNPQMVSII